MSRFILDIVERRLSVVFDFRIVEVPESNEKPRGPSRIEYEKDDPDRGAVGRTPVSRPRRDSIAA